MVRCWWLSSLIVATGCGQSVVISAVPNDGTFKTEVLAYGLESSGEPIESDKPEAIYVIDLRDPGAPYRFDLPDVPRRLEAFLFKQPIGSFGVTTGELHSKEGSPPIPDQTYASIATDGAVATWSLETMPKWLDDVLFVPLTPADCLVKDGCFVGGQCHIPCPAQSEVMEPTPPEFPNAECAPGWIRREVEPNGSPGVFACDVVSPKPDDCPDGRIAFPGDENCAPVGSACGSSEYPADIIGVAVYVKPSGQTGAAGTAVDPVASLAEALALAPDGATIAVAAGHYSLGTLDVDRPVTILGRCPDMVELEGRIETTSSLTLANLRLTGAFVARAATDVHLDRVVIDGTSDSAITAQDSVLAVDRLLIRGAVDHGVRIERGTLSGTNLAIVSPAMAGILVESATVGLANVVITNAGDAGAVHAVMGASVAIDRLAVYGGRGMRATGAAINIAHAMLDGLSSSALVADTASVSARWVWIDDVQGNVWNALNGSTLKLDDVVMTHVGAVTDGIGVGAASESTAVLNRVAVIDAADDIVWAVEADLTINDLIVHDTRRADLQIGDGLVLTAGTKLVMNRAEFLVLSGSAARSYECKSLVLGYIQFRDSAPVECLLCTGLCFKDTESVRLERFEATNLHGSALRDVKTTIEIDNLMIDTVVPAVECVLRGATAGIGSALIGDSSAMKVERFVIRNAAAAGVELTVSHPPAPVGLRVADGIIEHCTVGIDFRTAGDFRSIFEGVDFTENQTPLNSRSETD